MPLAPALLSTTTACFVSAVIEAPSARASWSVALPAANGTMKVTGRSGYLTCAPAGVAAEGGEQRGGEKGTPVGAKDAGHVESPLSVWLRGERSVVVVPARCAQSASGTTISRSSRRKASALPWLSRLRASLTPPSSTSSSTKFIACSCGSRWRVTFAGRRCANCAATRASVTCSTSSGQSAGCQAMTLMFERLPLSPVRPWAAR